MSTFFTFEEAFFRTLMCTASVYLMGRQPEDASTPQMPDHCWRRLEGYNLKSFEVGLRGRSGAWLSDVAIVDAKDVDKYGGIHSQLMPCILCKSEMFDLVSQSRLGVQQVWLAQGFPHPGARSELGSLVELFPFDLEDVAALTDQEQKGLLGNCMHVAQIGAWFLYNVACSRQAL